MTWYLCEKQILKFIYAKLYIYRIYIFFLVKIHYILNYKFLRFHNTYSLMI